MTRRSGVATPAAIARATVGAGLWQATAPRTATPWSQQTTRSFSGERFGDSGGRKQNFEPLNVNKIAVIGGGNMADAIVTGVLSKNLLASEKIVVSDPNLRAYRGQEAFSLGVPFAHCGVMCSAPDP
jgi:hypothetical protein